MKKLMAILRGKCPACYKGALFEHPNPYVLSKLVKMHPQCPHCGQDFKIEPGFYFGAAYISYALNVAVFVITFVITYFILGYGMPVFIAALVSVMVLLIPFFYRLSRSAWIHFFVKYKG